MNVVQLSSACMSANSSILGQCCWYLGTKRHKSLWNCQPRNGRLTRHHLISDLISRNCFFPFFEMSERCAKFHRPPMLERKHSANGYLTMAVSSWVAPWCSPSKVQAPNWCRANGEAGIAGVARWRLGHVVWRGRPAKRSTMLLQMACAEMSGASTSSAATSFPAATDKPQKQAADMVQEFYGAVNRREVASIENLFAEDCVYEDLVFPKPFVGRKAIVEFFQKFVDSVGSELEFKIDDITTGDPNAAGVSWHLEWKGKPFPFSKGCSFYRCQVFNGQRQFIYGRDAVEPATKPGDFTLVALKGLGALLRRFPSLADRF